MSLLEQDTIRKEWVDENATQLEFKPNNDEEYKIIGIRNIAIYAKTLEASHLLGFSYLVSWKSYPEKKDT